MLLGGPPTERMATFSRALRLYVIAVASIGGATIVHSLVHMYMEPVGWKWLVLALLTLLSGSATVKLPLVPATISISETFVFTSALLFGTAAGTLTVALDALAISFWLARRRHPTYRIAFNVFALPAALWAGSTVYYLLSPVPPLGTYADELELSQLLFPLIAFTVVYFGLNSWLLAIAISLERQQSPFAVWRTNFALLSLNYFGGASIAALLVIYTKDIDLFFVAFVLPLLVALYFTFWLSMRRVDDSNKHLSQLNRLYISTIETLAMAIDAKDQITHGHIRRVQHYAVGLARHMGIADQAQISAIEAASLLHDMGKLAIPEYILNKPGKLTTAEFDKMKLHASVGAEILSAIDFPYPVVPIVRHHHENWNGTGYPDQLKGNDIPIGARILSVVDCFDALTSDRPYRPRLTNHEAIRILLERRGFMYDPLVIDTFVRVHGDLERSAADVYGNDAGFSAVTRGALPLSDGRQLGSDRADDVLASTEELLVLFDIAQGLTAHIGVADAADLIAKHLCRVIPACTVVFFLYDAARDTLVAVHTTGDHSSRFASLEIPRGERLTGWVAANRQVILNSDPVLDLGEIARSLRPPLRSCLSTPLMVSQQLVGTLTAYSHDADGFTEDHVRVLDIIGGQVAHTLRRALDVERDRATAHRDVITGLPNVRELGRVVLAQLSLIEHSAGFSILSVRIPQQSRIPHPVGSIDVVFERALAETIRSALRAADLLFHVDANSFVVLLLNTDVVAMNAVAQRVAHRLAEARDGRLGAATMIGLSRVPDDGVQLSDLMDRARQREKSPAEVLTATSTAH
jgi:putative nucleotidyltransferase with HDIG domain